MKPTIQIRAGRLLALTVVIGASLLTASCWDKQSNSGDNSDSGGTSSASSSGLEWDVGYESNKLNPALEATATHDIDGGGKVAIGATCDSESDSSSITLDFEYHAKDSGANNDANSSYDTEGSGNFEHVAVPYRFDGGEIQQANSQTDYKNSARVVFAYISPTAKGDAVEGLGTALAAMFGGIQNLSQFLHAQEVDFQLPLGGGTTEIVKVNPQDSGFQQFVSKCKIDLSQIDAEVAKQKADEKTASDAKAQNDAGQQSDQQDQAGQAQQPSAPPPTPQDSDAQAPPAPQMAGPPPSFAQTNDGTSDAPK